MEAPTATGKTEAVLFPLLTNAANHKKNSVQILYLGPLKALLNDLEPRVRDYATACGLHVFKWHGDVGQKKKIEEMNMPSQVLLTTPESLEAILLRRSNWHDFFSGLEVTVIDEAHNFAGSDRGGHMMNVLERVEAPFRTAPRRIGLTATVGNADDMLAWLAGRNRDLGKRLSVGFERKPGRQFSVRCFPSSEDERGDESHSGGADIDYLYRRVFPGKKTIVFSNSRKNSESVANQVNLLNRERSAGVPIKVRTHHSAVSKYYREAAERLIKVAAEDGLQAIISTSTLELGIDIGELDQVVQMGPLSSPSSFMQRVGRTGRRENKPQIFKGICCRYDDLLILSAVISLAETGVAERIYYPSKAYHLLAHQLVCMSLQSHGIRPRDAWTVLDKSYCFRDISYNDFEELINYMIDQEYFRVVDGSLVVGAAAERSYLGSNWRKLFAVFDSGPMYDVVDGKHHVGTLDGGFVESLDVPFFFVLGGIEWKATKIRSSAKVVSAEKGDYGSAPKWLVYGATDIPKETAKEAGRLLFSKKQPEFLADDITRECFDALQLSHEKIGWNPAIWKMLVSASGKAEIWTFAGDRINRTLALFLTQKGIGRCVSNFKYVSLVSERSFPGDLKENIQQALAEIANMDETMRMHVYGELCSALRPLPFSKFSKCLPETFWKQAQGERVFDVNGLVTDTRSDAIQYEFT